MMSLNIRSATSPHCAARNPQNDSCLYLQHWNQISASEISPIFYRPAGQRSGSGPSQAAPGAIFTPPPYCVVLAKVKRP